MRLVSVDMDRCPQHEEALRKHALKIIRDGRTAMLMRSTWQDIQAGREPRKVYGLGDLIASATRTIGIESCGGCDERKEILNQVRL